MLIHHRSKRVSITVSHDRQADRQADKPTEMLL